MKLRVCTVLSAREWESELVAVARETAAVRLVLRAYQPRDLEEAQDEIDVVVAGAETSWVTPAQIASWRRRGLRVVGIHPRGDAPARRLLELGGAEEILPDDTPTTTILQIIRLLTPVGVPEPPGSTVQGRLVGVTGARGGPGRTEVALTLAWERALTLRTLLVDLDQEAPSLAIRLGIPPRPDLADAVDSVRTTGVLGPVTHEVDRLTVIVGSHRPGENLVRPPLLEELVEAALADFDLVVLDLGPCQPDDLLLKRCDGAVLVVEASAVGLVRGARLVAEWAGPPPSVVLNRADAGERGQLAAATRKWLGLEPAVVLPDRPGIRRGSRSASPPDPWLRRRLARLEVPR